MKKLVLLLAISMVLCWNIGMAGEIYRWVDEKGIIYFSDSPPPYGSFKKQRIEDQIDKTIEKKEEIDKKSDIDESEKFSEKLKIDIEHQKKAKAIRDYNLMREELRALEEKYQQKHNELKRQWDRNFPRSSGRHDILDEVEKLKIEYQKEIRQIKEYYGYH